MIKKVNLKIGEHAGAMLRLLYFRHIDKCEECCIEAMDFDEWFSSYISGCVLRDVSDLKEKQDYDCEVDL